ncbi:hypothetical protein SBADM41S_04348 [Streptomyces badius]
MDSDITDTEPQGPRGGRGDVDAGAYEVLRRRLSAQAGELVRRAEALNARRTEEFGSTGLRLLATEQVRTEHPSVPRDLVAVGGKLLFGFERGPGARGEAGVDDVLLVRDAEEDDGTAPPPRNTLLDDDGFRREFASLHRYFRDARLLRLRRTGGKLLAVFRTGENAEDIRVLRWALGADGSPGAFLDAQGERDHVFPASHDFDWTVAGREAHRTGRHPHIAIGKGGGLFVDTLGGTLTVKVTDDTESPDGIYEEPVDEPLQSLADADVEYAEVGPLTLLRVRPYKETDWRYLVFNSLLGSVQRLDSIGPACHRLPEDQGIIFPGGYYLTTGTAKTFDTAEELTEPVFEGAVRSPNGEDVLYVFRSRDGLRSLLLPYNLIRQEVATPLTGRGHALLDDGTLVLLRDNPDGPARVHPLQRWQTPYVSDTYAAARPAGTGPLARTGNADLVRGISDCLALAHGVQDMTPTAAVYGQLASDCARAQDRYHWLSDPELGALGEPLAELRATAQQVLAEFTAVQDLTRRAADALEETAGRITALVRRVRGEVPGSASAWVERLTELRQAHGHLATVGEMRYADAERIAELSARTEDDIASAAQRAVSFLAREDAFDGYHADIAGLVADAGALETVRDASAVTDRLAAMTEGLATVTDVVAGLDIGDATVRTSILERIAEVLGGANRARATLDARRRELLSKEGRAEFAAEFALLGQAVTGALAAADSPEACDDQLARLLLQLENLESRFAEFDDFLAELAERRTEVYEAFSAREQTLQDEPRRGAERPRGRLRAELRGERADRKPGPRPARRALARRPDALGAAGGRQRPGGPRRAPGTPVQRCRVGPHPGGAAPSPHGPGHRARGERRVHRVGRADGRHPHRTAVPAPGLLPQHEQDRRADRAGDERRRTVRRHRRPLRGRGPDAHHRGRGEPAEAGRPARHAHRRTGGAVGGDQRFLRPYAGARRAGGRPDDPGRGRARAARGPDRGGRDGDPAGGGPPAPARGRPGRRQRRGGQRRGGRQRVGQRPAHPRPSCEDHQRSTLIGTDREDRAGRITACWVSCLHFLSSRDGRRPPAT